MAQGGTHPSVQALHPKLRGSYIVDEYDVVLRKLLGIGPLQGKVRRLWASRRKRSVAKCWSNAQLGIAGLLLLLVKWRLLKMRYGNSVIGQEHRSGQSQSGMQHPADDNNNNDCLIP